MGTVFVADEAAFCLKEKWQSKIRIHGSSNVVINRKYDIRE